MIAIWCALLSGSALYLSQGLNEVWWLAWLAPIPLLWLAWRPAAARQVFLAGLAAALAGQIYLVQCYAPHVPLRFLVPMLLPLLAPCVLFAGALLFVRFVHQRLPATASLLAFPASYTAIEYLVGLASPHGSYGSWAYSQASAPVVLQTASLFGLYAVTFLICLFAAAAALLLRREPGSVRVAGAGIAVCLLALAFGVVRLHQPQAATVRVAALADDDSQDRAMNAATPEARAADYAAGTAAIAEEIRRLSAQGVTLVVLPEGGLIASPPWQDLFVAPLAKATGTQVIAGIYRPDPPGDLAVSFSPDGSVRTYDKRHLVPVLDAEFTPGTGPGLLGHGLAMAICKDMDFPATTRRDAQNGIRLMAVPAGDFGADRWIHARMSILRGVENGFSVVRAAGHGLLTASDAQGRVLARETTARPGVASIVTDLPLGPGPTLYTRSGDVFAWLALLCSAALGVLALRGGTPVWRNRRPGAAEDFIATR